MNAVATSIAAVTMARRLTAPFGRGADTLILALEPGATTKAAKVATYAFTHHRALYGVDPAPRYVVTALAEQPKATKITVSYEPTPGAAAVDIFLDIPAGTLAGTSLLLDLGADEGPLARLTRLTMSAAGPAPAQNLWAITALLGNMAKLLWVVGTERDLLRRQAALTLRQAGLSTASGRSLDLIGYGLGVPRFPPLNYGFDADTIALYALDDPKGSAIIADRCVAYGLPGHPGAVTGTVTTGVPGRFGTAASFAAGGEIAVANHANFAVTGNASLTVEGFVRPLGTATGHVLRKSVNPEAMGKGWALSLGDFARGIANNVRLVLCDGSARIVLFADRELPAGRFTHVAGVLDRGNGEARLLVDGEIAARRALPAPFGTLSNSDPLRIGTGLGAVIDEVRLSRVARADFAPALGEADESYRLRLGVFRRWTLPTAAQLRAVLNASVGQIGGQDNPLLVDDANASTFGAGEMIKTLPATLDPGGSLDAAGHSGLSEAASVGTVADDVGFDPRLLALHADIPGLTFAGPPPRVLAGGEAAPDPRRMNPVLIAPLAELVARASTAAPAATGLVVISAFDPRAEGVQPVGRALRLSHTGLDGGRLAALGHAAGFHFCRRLAASDQVYAAMAPAPPVIIRPQVQPVPIFGADLRVGDSLAFFAEPAPLAGLSYAWSVVPCGQGRLDIASPTETDRSVTMLGTAPGTVTLRCEIAFKGTIHAAVLTLRVGPADLAAGMTIGDDGNLGAPASIADGADAFFHPALIVTFDDPAVTAADLGARRMQAPLIPRLRRLLGFLNTTAPGTKLALQQGYLAGDPGLRGVGRQLRFSHATVDAGRLAVMAHGAGFTHVERQANAVVVRQRAEPPAIITGAAPVLAQGATLELDVSPRAGCAAVLASAVAPPVAGKVFIANAASDTVSEIDPATGLVRQAVKVGWGPEALALSPDGTRLFTADRAGGTVSMLNVATGAVTTIAVGAEPVALAHHPAQPRLYVACRGAKTLVEINTAGPAVLGNVATGAPNPVTLAIQPNGAALWLGLSDGTVRRVTFGPLALGAALALPAAPAGLAVSDNNARLYAACPGPTQPAGQPPGRVAIVDTAAATVLGSVAAGVRPGLIATRPGGGAVAVVDTNAGAERLHLFQFTAAAPFLAPAGDLGLRREPSGIATEGTRLYVTSRRDDIVSVISTVAAPGIETSWRLGTGLGDRLAWSLRSGRAPALTLSNTVTPHVRVTGAGPGTSMVSVSYTERDGTDPYTFEVRLDTPRVPADATITERQYDLIMNILSALAPMGVEVRTRAIRDRVIGVRAGLMSEAPLYTFPTFRVRGPTPRRTSKE